MKTLREKITFALTALAYILFHLAKSPENASIFTGTLIVLLNTLPYEIGFSYLIILFIRRTAGGEWPPWDRILRIFFTIGIVFGLIYSLYVRGATEQQKQEQKQQVSVSRSWMNNNQKAPLYWA